MKILKGFRFCLAGWFIILSVMVLTGVSWAGPVDVGAAKKEGKVVLYGTVPPRALSALNKAFEKKYDIKVEYWRGSSTKVLDRALTEWRAGRVQFDVVESTRPAQQIMIDEGAYAKYVPPSARAFSAQFRDKSGLITPWRISPVGILYNTDLVKSGDEPRSFSDLLDHKWKTQLAMPDPSRHTSTAQLLANMDKYFGVKAEEWIKSLAKQKPHFTVSYSAVPKAVIAGEVKVGITLIKYVRQFSGPMDYARLDKYLANDDSLAVSKKAPHPNAARLFVDFACSIEGQKIMANKGEFVLSPEANPPIPGAGQIKKFAVLQSVPSGEEFKQLKKKWRRIFFAK